MDAMQRQAMAQATARRRAGRRQRIIAALKRIDDDEFGYCQDCGEEIAAGRIALDPTVSLCLSCAKG
jgi:DnaK suppressor protein